MTYATISGRPSQVQRKGAALRLYSLRKGSMRKSESSPYTCPYKPVDVRRRLRTVVEWCSDTAAIYLDLLAI